MLKRYFIILSLMALTTGLAYLSFGRPELGVDDAHIFFVYGQNLVEGQGIVYNPGGERVEGFTSLLWMLIVALFFGLFARPEGWLMWFCLAMISGAIALLWRFVDTGGLISLRSLVHREWRDYPLLAYHSAFSRERFTWRGLVFVAWVFSSPGFVVWMGLALMESALWSTLLIGGALMTISSRTGYLALLVALLLLTRPEGMLWGLVFITLIGLIGLVRSGWLELWRRVRWPLLVYGLVSAGLALGRLAYFGYPLPNTCYAKMSPDIAYNLYWGLVYLATFLYFNPMVVVVSLGPAMAGLVLNLPRLWRSPSSELFFAARQTTRLEFVVLSVIALTGLAAPVLIGGDHFLLARFYQPVWPLLILSLFWMLDAVDFHLARPVQVGAALVVMGLFFVTPQTHWLNLSESRLQTDFWVAERGEQLGAALNEIFAEDYPAVGVTAAGSVALVYRGPVVDIYGLNNVAMAHAPGNRYGLKNHAAFNVDVFLAQQPELFLPTAGGETKFPQAAVTLREVLQDPRFLDLYQLARISDGKHQIVAYVKRSYLAQLAGRGLVVEPIPE